MAASLTIEQRHVCLVDDDPSYLRLVTAKLGKQLPNGVAVVPFSDPLLAERWLDSHRPLVVVCDLRMDGLSGFELVKQVKQKDVFTPTIVMTGYGSNDVLRLAIECGADDFFVKPHDERDLFNSICFFVERENRWRLTVLESESGSRPRRLTPLKS